MRGKFKRRRKAKAEALKPDELLIIDDIGVRGSNIITSATEAAAGSIFTRAMFNEAIVAMKAQPLLAPFSLKRTTINYDPLLDYYEFFHKDTAHEAPQKGRWHESLS